MEQITTLINALMSVIPDDCDGLLTEIEYYTKEKGYGIQGDCITIKTEFVRYMNYSGGINKKLSSYIHSWNNNLINTIDKWNKAQITVYRDGRSDVRAWWDEDFQKALYKKG